MPNVQQCLHDGAEVGSTLAVVAEPGTSIDVNHYGIALLLLFRKIDVAVVVNLAVADVVDILPLL